MSEAVYKTCDELVKAVNVMMDAEESQRYRLGALKFIEAFKEKCPFSIECGLRLAEKSQTAVVRHFGLQILDHVVKFQWNNMSLHEKVQLKNCTMGLVSNGVHPILEEECHIKDALSRIVVEMIKREWPQQWPEMLTEMVELTALGARNAHNPDNRQKVAKFMCHNTSMNFSSKQAVEHRRLFEEALVGVEVSPSKPAEERQPSKRRAKSKHGGKAKRAKRAASLSASLPDSPPSTSDSEEEAVQYQESGVSSLESPSSLEEYPSHLEPGGSLLLRAFGRAVPGGVVGTRSPGAGRLQARLLRARLGDHQKTYIND